MDQRLSAALEQSNLMVVINQQKRIIKQQYQADLVHYQKGCQFTADQELISFCQSMIQLGQTQSVIIDDNSIPCLVENLENFASDLVETYASATNGYFNKYERLKTQRNTNGIIL
jgi:hypothetical protein